MNYLAYTKIAAAAAPKYKLLEPSVIGQQGPSVSISLADYVQAIYKMSLTFGAVAAVLIIVYAGIEYILSFKITSKEAAKKRINNALVGLIILLLITMVLGIINPELINLKALNPTINNPGPAATPGTGN